MPDTNRRRQAARRVLDHDPAKLRRRRFELGLEQQEVALAAGISPSHMCEVEGGTRNPSPGLLKRLAEALNCEIRDLMPDRLFRPPGRGCVFANGATGVANLPEV